MWVQVGKCKVNNNIYTNKTYFKLKKDNYLCN